MLYHNTLWQFMHISSPYRRVGVFESWVCILDASSLLEPQAQYSRRTINLCWLRIQANFVLLRFANISFFINPRFVATLHGASQLAPFFFHYHIGQRTNSKLSFRQSHPQKSFISLKHTFCISRYL